MKTFSSFGWNDDLYKVDTNGRTRLIIAAAVGDIALIDLLVKQGANLHHVDADGWDALFHAVNACQPNAVRHLIVAHGLNPNARDKHGRTPIMIAAARGDIPTIETLIECGANPHEIDPDGWDVLMYASGYGQPHAVTHFISRYGMDPNRSDRHGLTSAIIASAKGHGPIIDLLFENGADITHADCQLRTALHHALIIFDPIQYKTQPLPILDDLKRLASSLLSSYLSPTLEVETIIDIIRRLVSKYKLDLNRPDLYGNTPLMYAVKYKAQIVSLLNDSDSLNYAARQHNLHRFDPVIKTLIELGANPSIVNNEGESAFMIAEKFDFKLKADVSTAQENKL